MYIVYIFDLMQKKNAINNRATLIILKTRGKMGGKIRSTRIGKFYRPWIKRLIDSGGNNDRIYRGKRNPVWITSNTQTWMTYLRDILYNNDSVISNITIERRAFACCDVQFESREYPMDWRDVKEERKREKKKDWKEYFSSIIRRRASWMRIIKCIANCRLYFRREGSLDSTIHQLSRKLTLLGS